MATISQLTARLHRLEQAANAEDAIVMRLYGGSTDEGCVQVCVWEYRGQKYRSELYFSEEDAEREDLKEIRIEPPRKKANIPTAAA